MAAERYDMTEGEPIQLAVEGVIGVGKTTLVQALAERLGAVRLSEEQLVNPFLEKFYKQSSRWALACQTWFLEARLAQFAAIRPVGVPVVSDHSLIKEPIFASVNLVDEELALYERLYQRLVSAGVGFRPHVTIYLTASVSEVRSRIRERGRRGESTIDVGYLGQLVDAYQAWFDGAQDSGERIVVVDADGVNVAADPEAVDRLIDACLHAPHGVSFCNPT